VCVGCGTVLEEFARALEPLQGRSISAFARRVGELFQHFVTCFVVPLDIGEGFIWYGPFSSVMLCDAM
jgi:hypothetical protein